MKGKTKLITLIICTYNRNKIIKYCLDSLGRQLAGREKFEILVVNNYENELVGKELESIVKKYSNVRVCYEKIPGLSNARNTGARVSDTEWVGYLDDDCIAEPDYILRAIEIIDQHNFECFGGHISPWWLYGRPKWLDINFSAKPILSKQIVELKDSFVWGGNMFYRQEALFKVGGFDPKIGMKKDRIGYSAENRVQMNMRKLGYKIGYDPQLRVKHLVAKHKLRPRWHLRSAFAEGRDAKEIFPDQYTPKALFKDMLRASKNILTATYKIFINKSIYHENWILSVLKPWFKIAGKMSSFLNSTT